MPIPDALRTDVEGGTHDGNKARVRGPFVPADCLHFIPFTRKPIPATVARAGTKLILHGVAACVCQTFQTFKFWVNVVRLGHGT